MINRKMQTWTRIFMAVIAVTIAVYDVYVIVAGGTGTTISHEIITMSYKYPAFTFLMGFICGHLFGACLGQRTLTK